MLLLLVACTAREPELTRPEAARVVTFGTLTALGSFQMESSVERATRYGDNPPQVVKTATELRWQDPDHWSLRTVRDGTVETRTVVWDAVGWLSTPAGRLERRPDAEPLRAALSRSWDPWAEALGAYEAQLQYEPMGTEEVAGRKAERFAVSLVPEDPKKKRRPAVRAVQGDLWLDEATSARLQASVTLTAESRDRTVDIQVLLAVSRVGEDLGLTDPSVP